MSREMQLLIFLVVDPWSSLVPNYEAWKDDIKGYDGEQTHGEIPSLVVTVIHFYYHLTNKLYIYRI